MEKLHGEFVRCIIIYVMLCQFTVKSIEIQ